MRYFLDTEFIEDGKTIDLISIGIVLEDGREYYAENEECDLLKASEWVKENVLKNLRGGQFIKKKKQIAHEIICFIDENPEFWGYFADYDWVVFCQLFGTMMDLPKNFPMYCRDIKQLIDDNPSKVLLPPCRGEHNALNDARWNKEVFQYLTSNPYELNKKKE